MKEELWDLPTPRLQGSHVQPLLPSQAEHSARVQGQCQGAMENSRSQLRRARAPRSGPSWPRERPRIPEPRILLTLVEEDIVGIEGHAGKGVISETWVALIHLLDFHVQPVGRRAALAQAPTDPDVGPCPLGPLS